MVWMDCSLHVQEMRDNFFTQAAAFIKWERKYSLERIYIRYIRTNSKLKINSKLFFKFLKDHRSQSRQGL